MSLLGYNDYDQFCDWLMSEIEKADQDEDDLQSAGVIGEGGIPQ